jgi:hypothetical protein
VARSAAGRAELGLVIGDHRPKLRIFAKAFEERRSLLLFQRRRHRRTIVVEEGGAKVKADGERDDTSISQREIERATFRSPLRRLFLTSLRFRRRAR